MSYNWDMILFKKKTTLRDFEYIFLHPNYNNNNKVSLLKHASTQSKAHKTKTGSGKGQASHIRPNIYAEKSNVCNLLLKQDVRLVLK